MDISKVQNTGMAAPAMAETVAASRLAQNRELIQAVRTVNAAELLGQDNELVFLLDRETRRPVLRIVSRTTNEVIRQVPPEYVLHLAEEMRELNEEN
ncbi:MAG: flagellar protein FlaG [Acidobacteria bacterium]|nr:flagellar protein FlaG [Acidobacteriota bacterium]